MQTVAWFKSTSRLIRILVLFTGVIIFVNACHPSVHLLNSTPVSSPQLLKSKPALTPPQAAIASAHPLATQAGLQILQQGGNAFDAAVAVAATLAVVEPYSSGLGGGGFWLLHRASDQQNLFIDARETAPLAAHVAMYQRNGLVNRDAATNGALAAAIPGLPAALDEVTQQYGRNSLSINLAKAIELADHGFMTEVIYQRWLEERQAILQRYPSSQHFIQPNGGLLRQPELANTLQELAAHGRDGFYQGRVAQQLVNEVRAAGGIWQLQDLIQYQVKYRQPIITQYHDMRIISAPLPSSGGLLLANMLAMLQPYDQASLPPVARTHLLTEVMRRAYQQRSQYLGDSDFVSVPEEKFLNSHAAQEQMRNFDWQRATVSQAQPVVEQGTHTTHFVVLDREGNRVSATLSINLPFGSAFTSAGVLLNNEMDDFDAAPNQANAYGLVGTGANRIQPGKRPLSSMSPTFIETAQGVGLLGTPGGSRIISMVLLGILDAETTLDPQHWVNLPRFHHQYMPDQLEYEPQVFTQSQINELQQLGHSLKKLSNTYGNMQAIFWNQQIQKVEAASDPRGLGQASVQ